MDSSDKALSVSRHLTAAVQGKKCLDSNDKDIAERRAFALPCLEVIPEVYRDCACIEHIAEQQPHSLKHAAMTLTAFMLFLLTFVLSPQGSSISVSSKVMFTTSLKNWHYNKTKMLNVYIRFKKTPMNLKKKSVPCLVQHHSEAMRITHFSRLAQFMTCFSFFKKIT